MCCQRCGGLLVDEYIEDLLEGVLCGFQGWRCLNCGTILDEVIKANQALSLAVSLSQLGRSPATVEESHNTVASRLVASPVEDEPFW